MLSASNPGEGADMDVGAAIFFTDYSMGPSELGRALEERGFESLWFPEHTHIPTNRKSPWPGIERSSTRAVLLPEWR